MTRPSELTINITGKPAPQGSKKGIAIQAKGKYTGKVAQIESAGEKVKTWREDIRAAAMEAAELAGWTAPAGAVAANIVFYIDRPKGHYRTGRNAHLLRDAAPTHHITKPDKDKLERATLDALTSAGVVHDDSRIVGGSTWKAYADGRPAGAVVTLLDLETMEDTDQ